MQYLIELCLGVDREKLLLTEDQKGFGSTTRQRAAQQYRTRDLAGVVLEQLMHLPPKDMRALIRKEPTHTAPVTVSIKTVDNKTPQRSKLYTFINQE